MSHIAKRIALAFVAGIVVGAAYGLPMGATANDDRWYDWMRSNSPMIRVMEGSRRVSDAEMRIIAGAMLRGDCQP